MRNGWGNGNVAASTSCRRRRTVVFFFFETLAARTRPHTYHARVRYTLTPDMRRAHAHTLTCTRALSAITTRALIPRWQPLPPMPAPRHCAVGALCGDATFVVGGCQTASEPLSTVFAFSHKVREPFAFPSPAATR